MKLPASPRRAAHTSIWTCSDQYHDHLAMFNIAAQLQAGGAAIPEKSSLYNNARRIDALNVRKAPRFIEVLGSHANLNSRSVDVLFGGSDGEKYGIEVDPAIVAALVVSLQGETKELRDNLPDLDTLSQALRVNAMSAAMDPNGDLAWTISLDGDLDVNLAFSAKEFDALFRQMEEVRQLLHGNRH